MNTPAHAIINLLLFPKKNREAHSVAIVSGALLPDAPMLVFYAWARLNGQSERWIWREGYFDPAWQAVFDTFHSLPLIGLAWLVAWRSKMATLSFFLASMFMHSLFDFLLHHDDAHRHFFPLSDFRFASPVSYWDPAWHGQAAGTVELIVVGVGSVWLLRMGQGLWLKRCVASILFLYLLFWSLALLVQIQVSV